MNKKFQALTAIAFAFSLSLAANTAAAEDGPDGGKRYQSPQAILADLLMLRPAGLGLTAIGAALVVGSAPITAIASIAPPHDAFERTANALFIGPAAFTFYRPLGEYTYQPNGVYPARP